MNNNNDTTQHSNPNDVNEVNESTITSTSNATSTNTIAIVTTPDIVTDVASELSASTLSSSPPTLSPLPSALPSSSPPTLATTQIPILSELVVNEEIVALNDTLSANTNANNASDELHNQIISLNENKIASALTNTTASATTTSPPSSSTSSSSSSTTSSDSVEFIMQNETSEKCSDNYAADKRDTNINTKEDTMISSSEPSPPTPTPAIRRTSILINSNNNINNNNNDINDSDTTITEDEDVKTKSSRHVSFPENDNELVTGYLEPVDPWKNVKPIKIGDLKKLYIENSFKYHAQPLDVVLSHLDELTNVNLTTPSKSTILTPLRSLILNLKNTFLTHSACEALEEIFKNIQYRLIDLTSCGLDDVSATSMFDMIEYYESTNELDISDNQLMKNRGWQSCISMIKKSKSLNVLIARGTPILDSATNLGAALNLSYIHTLKLENCGVGGKSIEQLCMSIKKNTFLRELWLANNDFSAKDGMELGLLLKTNYYLQFLDISNNNLQDVGVEFIADALIEQSDYFRNNSDRGYKTQTKLDLSIFSCSLNDLNRNRNRFSPTPFSPSSVLSSSTEEMKNYSNDNKNTDKFDNDTNVMNKNISLIDDSRSDCGTVIINDDIKDLMTFTDDAVDDDNNDELIKDCSIIINNKNVLNENNCDINLSSTSSISSTTNSSLKSSMTTTADTSASDLLAMPSMASSLPLKLDDNISLDDSDMINELPNSVSQPVRSFSSESLNSEASIGSNDSKSSLKLIEAKFTSTNKNGTLERQQSSQQSGKSNMQNQYQQPRGLQILILWNNSITRSSGDIFAQLIDKTHTLEILNIGRNYLSSDFLLNVKNSMKVNTSITNIGFQGAHLSDSGAKILSDILQFGGNSTLQRIDLRDNNIQTHGLIALNDALKSNKTITRIDLDDVPRRITESTENHTEYTRLLNSIRGHCARNENPPEPTEPISTSVKRVRANYINSRKISLTCHSVSNNNNNNNYMSTTTITNSPKDKHLDPSFKKSSGRLRSPLPSPAPSPIISPCPSPSRNRFQVSRVVENINNNNSGNINMLSSSPSPSSTGSSPTFFSPNNSRFRVTTVNEPHKNKNTVKPFIAPTPLTTVTTTTPSSSSIAITPTSSTTATTKSTINICNKTSTVTTPTSLNTINYSKPFTPVSNTTVLPLTSYMHSINSPKLVTASTPIQTPQHPTSFDSPDLEVKRYMMNDSCCSSISSSIDSIDCMLQADLGNTSMSSTDSFDMIIMKPAESKISSLNVRQQQMNSNNNNNNRNNQNKILLQSQQRINNSLSSLDMSTSSQESLNQCGCLENESDTQSVNMNLKDVLNVDDNTHTIGSVVDDDCHLRSRIISSNEGTLTNSPCEETVKHVSDDFNVMNIKSNDFEQSPKHTRVRKTSWIPPLNSMIHKFDNITSSDGNATCRTSPTSAAANVTGSTTITTSSNYPATLDKLLSLFQHPFQRLGPDSASSKKECNPLGKDDKEQQPQQPTRKESPMGGLFAWAQGNSCKKNSQIAEQQTSSPSLSPLQPQQQPQPLPQSPLQAQPQQQALSSQPQQQALSSPQHLQLNTNILQPAQPMSATMSPENTVTNNSPNIDLIPIDNLSITDKIKNELKENISPENTITSSTVSDIINMKVLRQNEQEQLSPNSRKVVFKVGDIDPDDEDDFDETAEMIEDNSGATLRTNTRFNSGNSDNNNKNVGLAEHSGLTLGQITRDSLSILKGQNTSSQDSMRSLDSLSEMSDTMLAPILETNQQ